MRGALAWDKTNWLRMINHGGSGYRPIVAEIGRFGP
jgi:hypothetical protein